MTYLETLKTIVNAVKEKAPSAAINHWQKGYIPIDEAETEIVKDTNFRYVGRGVSETLLVNVLIVNMESGSYISFNLDSLVGREAGEDIIKEVVNERIDAFLNIAKTANDVIDNIEDFNYAQRILTVRLLPFESIKEKKDDIVYKVLNNDIALVLYITICREGGVLSTAKVTRKLAKKWGKRDYELLVCAFQNIMKTQRPVIGDISAILGGNLVDVFSENPINLDTDTWMLTTTQQTNGAVAIFVPGVPEQIADLLDDNFYVAFTSIHEVMIHKASESTLDGIYTALDSTNKNFGKEDYLSSTVYFYNRDEGDFFPARMV